MAPRTPGRFRPALAFLAVGAGIVAVAVALDQWSVAEKRRKFATAPVDPRQLAAPDPGSWRAVPIPPDTAAPEFTLTDVRTGMRVSLDDFHGRPVVLLLSSYGCNIFCNELGSLIALHKKHQDQVAFLFISIRDAGHPDPKTSPPVGAPRPGESAPEARLRLVREGAEFLDLPFPALLDADGEVERAYNAFPKRLVVVGPDGRIVYDGGRGVMGGPSAWNLTEVEHHIRSAIGRIAE